MCPRVKGCADIIVDHYVDVLEGDNVLITAPVVANERVVSLYDTIGWCGDHPQTQ